MRTDPYTMLLSEELRIVLKTREIREKLVDDFIDHNDGMLTKGGDIRVVNEVLDSLDSQVLGLVDKRQKQEDSKTNEDMVDMVKNIFIEIDSSKNKYKGTQVTTDIGDKFIPDDLVPGEDQVEYEEIVLSDIIKD